MSEQQIFEFDQKPPIKGFPELRWTGKRPYRSTVYFPAQIRERYGSEAKDGWINRIYWGDNLQVMSHLMKDFQGKVDLIYIDPPFDSKADYKKKIALRSQTVMNDSTAFEEKQYGDIWTNDEYLQFMYERLILMRELLSNTGSIYLHCDWNKSHYLRCLLDEVFGTDNFRNELYWYYYNKMPDTRKGIFPRSTDTIFWYAKERSQAVFNPLREQREQPVKQLVRKKIDGKMVNARDALGNIMYRMSETRVIDNVWRLSMLQPADKTQNLFYPTQKPESVLERIINASTNPGNIVFDCFMGSGTTQAVAMKLGRRFIGADINLGAIQTTTKRLISIAAELDKPQLSLLSGGKKSEAGAVKYESGDNKTLLVAEKTGGFQYDDEYPAHKIENTEDYGEPPKYTGFEVYNVNNYEFFRNPVEARQLIIDMYQIQPFGAGNVYDGELDGRMVKIMPVNRIATPADLEELKANLPYKTFDKRKEENPNEPVERITIICMGHTPDLKGSLELELADYRMDIEIWDILRDKERQFKREAEADIAIEGGRLVIRQFYPLNLMQKLSLDKEFVEDWRQLAESVMIDWNFDGVVMEPAVTDVPGKNELVKGIYDIPKTAGTIKVKITDLLSESLEAEVRV